jgi:glycosyltransferase involved in cell wall biosynthesis
MRVLLVTSRYPVPAWRGNQVRTIEWASALYDCEMLVACPRATGADAEALSVEVEFYPLSPGRRAIGLLRAAVSGRPFQEGVYDSTGSRRAVADATRRFSPDVVVIQMVRCGWAAEAVRSADPEVPFVFDAIDAMGLHFERAAKSSSIWTVPLLKNEAARCRRREHWLSSFARCTVAVSRRDLEELAAPPGRGRVIPVAGREAVVPEVSTSEKVVVLTGNLGYRPTVRGAVWFSREVWPRIRSRVPDARWVLAGARPAAAVRRLSRLGGVEVHTDVPDLGAYVARARLAVAPMNSGSGVPMKVLEAMAAGVPAVVHPWAAQGLTEDAAGAVVVADSAEAWADEIVRLLDDAEAARAAGEKGRTAWSRAYHPDVVAQQIRDVVAEAGEQGSNV